MQMLSPGLEKFSQVELSECWTPLPRVGQFKRDIGNQIWNRLKALEISHIFEGKLNLVDRKNISESLIIGNETNYTISSCYS